MNCRMPGAPEGAKKRVLILDIDGVLNSIPFCESVQVLDKVIVALDRGAPDGDVLPRFFDTTTGGNVEQMRRVLAAVPDAEIVVASDWRVRFDFEAVRRLLARILGVPVARVTDQTPRSFKGYRDREIEEWVKPRRHLLSGLVVVDDLPLSFRDDLLFTRFIQTDPNVGFTKEDADRAISLLLGDEHWALVMTNEVLEEVLKLLCAAHGGCPDCVGDLAGRFAARFSRSPDEVEAEVARDPVWTTWDEEARENFRSALRAAVATSPWAGLP